MKLEKDKWSGQIAIVSLLVAVTSAVTSVYSVAYTVHSQQYPAIGKLAVHWTCKGCPSGEPAVITIDGADSSVLHVSSASDKATNMEIYDSDRGIIECLGAERPDHSVTPGCAKQGEVGQVSHDGKTIVWFDRSGAKGELTGNGTAWQTK